MGCACGGVKNGEPDDLVTLVANDDVVVGQLAVGCVSGLPEVDVQHVGLAVIVQPNGAIRTLRHRRDQADVVG